MSRIRKTYSAEFKTKIVLEVIKGEKTLSEIASDHNITPKNIQNWKRTFLENAEIAMEPGKVVKEYKDEIIQLREKNDEFAKSLGKVIVERDWLQGKLLSLGLSEKQKIVEPKLEDLSLSRQCELLKISRGFLYRKTSENTKKEVIKEHIVKVFEEIPIYGENKVHQQLLEDGFSVSLNTVSKYRRELGLKAILAVKPISTTVNDISHPKYSYKLRGMTIDRSNQVWSTDITYIKIKGGMVYLAAVIDWYSKAVLSWQISNCMDTDLVMEVLNQALLHYPKPEIFNTDQGSQYTSHIHTQKLLDNGIIVSMDGKGRATDNIAIERFWRSAKCERIYLNEYNRIKELKDDVNDYIEFYNHKRFHETLGYKTPIDIYYKSLKINNANYDYNFVSVM